MVSGWNEDLVEWLQPFLDRLGHKARRRMCPLYVGGLIGAGERKSIEPMAARMAPGAYDRLHHFVSDGVWVTAPLEVELAVRANELVGGSDSVLVVDDTALPKKGRHSVGVAPQYASALGKTANCQTLVSLTLAKDEVPIAVALRLFLPESWTSDPARLDHAGVPEAWQAPRTKPQIALAEIDRLIAAGISFGTVLADAGYGLSAPFRQGLTARRLAWAVGIPRQQKVYPVDVALIFPMASRGRPRKNAVARRAPGRSAPRQLLPHRLHAARRYRRHCLPEQGRDLRHAVQGIRRDHDHHRCRSKTPRRQDGSPVPCLPMAPQWVFPA
jgi:SRSO17 transposase